jgi:hypothetical protein
VKPPLVVTPPGGALARPKAKPAAAGLALINEVLDADAVEALVHSESLQEQVQGEGSQTNLGDGQVSPRFLDRAKPLHASWLPGIVRAVHVEKLLFTIMCGMPRVPLTQASATAMLHYLFGAMGKRRGDEAAAKLLACTDIFSPASNALGKALGLWKPAPTHPAILAIAIKQLMAAKVYEPAEAELREALDKVEQRLALRRWYVGQWIDKLCRADEIVFTFDRPAWDAAYANASSDVPLQMQGQLFYEEPGEDDPPSPHWLALNALWEAKLEAEQAAELVEASDSEARIAACKAAPAKRTRKPKRTRKAKDEHA